MSNKLFITESDLRYLVNESVRRILHEDVSEWDGLYTEYVKYLESIGRYGKLQPASFNLEEVYRDIGYHTFFFGFCAEGELDEEGFAEFLEGFFKKYGEDVLKPDYDIDDIYNEYYPADLEAALTPEGLEKYLEEIDRRGKEWYENYCENLTFNDKGQIYCARAITLDKTFLSSDFEDNFGDEIGIYWSFNDSGAMCYRADGVYGPTVILKGWVNPCDVNWGESIQTEGMEEQELRIEDGAVIEVDSIVNEYNDEELPLKDSILLMA